MPRYVLIDTELDEVVGDSGLFFPCYLRASAHALGTRASMSEIETLTPLRAAKILDIITGDDIGWSYVQHPASTRLSGPGYEVREIPIGNGTAVPYYLDGDAALVAELRRRFRPAAMVEKLLRHVRERGVAMIAAVIALTAVAATPVITAKQAVSRGTVTLSVR